MWSSELVKCVDPIISYTIFLRFSLTINLTLLSNIDTISYNTNNNCDSMSTSPGQVVFIIRGNCFVLILTRTRFGAIYESDIESIIEGNK